jgi:hypothetical protein
MKTILYKYLKFIFTKTGIYSTFLPLSIQFLIKNKKYWKNSPSISNGYIITEVYSNIFLVLGTALTANILRIFYKLDIIYLDLYSDKNNGFYNGIRNSFSKGTYVEINKYKIENKDKIEHITQKEFEKIETVNDLLNYCYDGMIIGDLLYDIVLRTGDWTATVKLIDNRVKKALQEAILSIEFAKEFSVKYNVEVCTFSHNGGHYGFLLRYFSHHQKKVFVGTLGAACFKKVIYKRGEVPQYSKLHPSFPEIILNDSKIKATVLNKSNNYFNEYSTGKIINMDFSGAFKTNAKKFSNKETFCKEMGLDPSKRNVFIFLHAFNDLPKTFKTPYKDFFDWMIKTIDILKENDKVNCIIKVHPLNTLYPTEDFDIIEYLDEVVQAHSHIKYIDDKSDFTNESIPFIADVIGTCVGTAGLEYTCYGKKTFISGESSYAQFNICDNIENQEEYKEYLLNLDKVNLTVPPKTQEKAKLIFYLDYGVIMTAGTNSIDAFPLVTHIERLENRTGKLFKYYLSKLGSPSFEQELQRIFGFLENDKEITLFMDAELAKVEELSNTQ